MTIDFESLAAELQGQSLSLLQKWLPSGKLRGREYVCGNLQGDSGDSLSINIDTGAWADFAGGANDKGGDLISLYAAINKISNAEAAKKLGNGHDHEAAFLTGQKAKPPNNPSGVWEYKSATGATLGYICRYDKGDKKTYRPYTCWSDGWKFKAFPTPRPLYNLDKIAGASKILVVEGEKTAEAATLLLPDWVVTTWQGGASSVAQTDWTPLKGKEVWVWPDADEPGRTAASAILRKAPHATLVKLPHNLPVGWDLADCEPAFPVMAYLSKQELAIVAPSGSPAWVNIDPLNQSKILATLGNMRAVLFHYKIICRYNVISKRILHIVPGEEFSTENEEESALACIYSYMKEWKLPVDGHKMYLTRIADENQYNPVLDWIRSKPWDGKSRLPDLYKTIESTEEEAKELLIRRWLITAVCMALGEGIDSAGCLVLQGPQDIGKTWWVKSLVPPSMRKEFIRTDASVDPHDKDSVSQIISYWIVELGEIDATFKRSDLQALKSFITRDHDTMRRPYGEGDKRYPRRTALVASVDQYIFLYDTAGNRRFWTIPCTSINSYHKIDMQQLWAEALDLVENQGESWQLAPDEKAHIARINALHMQVEPIHELINQTFLDENKRLVKEWLTATEIGRAIDMKNITQRETRVITAYLRARKVDEKRTGLGVLFHV